jgi:hypothetical protein
MSVRKLSRRALFRGVASVAAVSALPTLPVIDAPTIIGIDTAAEGDVVALAHYDAIMKTIALIARVPVRYIDGSAYAEMSESDSALLERFHNRIAPSPRWLSE